jgi:hypothetical protein
VCIVACFRLCVQLALFLFNVSYLDMGGFWWIVKGLVISNLVFNITFL